VADQTALTLKGLSLAVFLVCSYYSVGSLSEPNELLDFNKSNRIEALFRLVFVLATLVAGLAAPRPLPLSKGCDAPGARGWRAPTLPPRLRSHGVVQRFPRR
jgi:hypothetical protein